LKQQGGKGKSTSKNLPYVSKKGEKKKKEGRLPFPPRSKNEEHSGGGGTKRNGGGKKGGCVKNVNHHGPRLKRAGRGGKIEGVSTALPSREKGERMKPWQLKRRERDKKRLVEDKNHGAGCGGKERDGPNEKNPAPPGSCGTGGRKGRERVEKGGN